MEKQTFIVYDGTETILRSWAKDLMTLLILAACVYISQGSKWWTIVVTVMVLIFLAGNIPSRRRRVFHSRAELIGWAIDRKGE